MKSDVCISIISHGHSDLIQRLGVVEKLAEEFCVIVKVNTEELGLISYLSKKNIYYIDGSKGLGFGATNNVIFEYYSRLSGGKLPRFFIILNPDVLIDTDTVFEIVSNMKSDKAKLGSITLYKDESMSCLDASIRAFPSLSTFITSFLGLAKSTVIDNTSLSQPTKVDWAAGSFLVFDGEHYASLNGFDEGYFMYCEDIDICYRSHLSGQSLVYYPLIKAVHFAARSNRRIFSKHFRWHLKSVVRYLLRKNGLLNKSDSRLG